MGASVGASKNPPKRTIDLAVIQKLCKEIYDKIREEKLYPEDIIKTVEGLKPSEEFVNFVSEVFSKMQVCSKMQPRRFPGQISFMERSITIGKDFSQPQIHSIHFPQKLVVYHKQASTAEASEV